MKIFLTTDINNQVTYFSSRKLAVEAINADNTLFPKAMGCHLSYVNIGTKKADLVFMMNSMANNFRNGGLA